MKNYKIKLGKLEKDMLDFSKKYYNEWSSYSTDSTTKRVVSSLKKKRLICTNKYHQFKLKIGRCQNGK